MKSSIVSVRIVVEQFTKQAKECGLLALSQTRHPLFTHAMGEGPNSSKFFEALFGHVDRYRPTVVFRCLTRYIAPRHQLFHVPAGTGLFYKRKLSNFVQRYTGLRVNNAQDMPKRYRYSMPLHRALEYTIPIICKFKVQIRKESFEYVSLFRIIDEAQGFFCRSGHPDPRIGTGHILLTPSNRRASLRDSEHLSAADGVCPGHSYAALLSPSSRQGTDIAIADASTSAVERPTALRRTTARAGRAIGRLDYTQTICKKILNTYKKRTVATVEEPEGLQGFSCMVKAPSTMPLTPKCIEISIKLGRIRQ